MSFIYKAFHPAALFVLLYPLLDFIIPYYPRAGYLGYLWVITVFIMVCFIAACSGRELLVTARSEHAWATAGMVIIWWIFLIAVAIPDRMLSDESLFQTGCPRIVLDERPDAGFMQQCFIGYPNRSYTMQVLGVYLFGFSPFAANIGASLYLFPGILLFAHGLRIFTAHSRSSDLLSALALAILFQSTILLQVIFYHDQTSQPVAFTFAFIGLAALSVLKQDRRALFVMLALVLIATAGYTPVLAVLGLVALFFTWAIRCKRLPPGTAGFVGLVGLIAIVAFLQTLAYREDLRLGVDSYNLTHLSARMESLWKFLLLQSGGWRYIEPVLQVVMFGVVLVGLTGRWGRYVFVLALWIIGVIFAGFFMAGASPMLAWYNMSGIHRSVPIFPVIATIAAIKGADTIGDRRLAGWVKAVIVASVCIPAVLGLIKHKYPNHAPLSWQVFKTAQRIVPKDVTPAPTLLTRDDIPTLGELPKHYLFLDRHRTFQHYAGTCLPQELPSPFTLVVTEDDELCAKSSPDTRYKEVGVWQISVEGEGVTHLRTMRGYIADTSDAPIIP